MSTRARHEPWFKADYFEVKPPVVVAYFGLWNLQRMYDYVAESYREEFKRNTFALLFSNAGPWFR